MKILLTTLLLFPALFSNAQLILAPQDFTNLVAISELYSGNVNASGDDFVHAVDALRTPALNNIADALIEVGKGEKTIFSSRFLFRPDNKDLIMWYVIREIHYNMTGKDSIRRSNIDVANEVLSKKTDERWLLDNYYYRIHGGIGLLFNSADLSNIDINIETLGLKNETEKAIFYFNMMEALIGGRFKVLQMMKNNQKILNFSDKLPLFNGRKYYYYKNFDFRDFDWIGYEETESYCERFIGNLYGMLIAQYLATSELRSKEETREIYFNSILFEPKYFKYSASKDDLQYLYDNLK